GGSTHPPRQKTGTCCVAFTLIYNERNPYAHYAVVITSVFGGALERAIRAAETAIALSPSFALGHLALGFARLSSGGGAEAVGDYEHGLRLNPFDPQNFVWFEGLAFARYFAGDREGALEAAMRALNIRPTWASTVQMLAFCCAALDRLEDARAYVEQMRHLEKPAGTYAQMKIHRPEWAAEIASMLRKAGLPE